MSCPAPRLLVSVRNVAECEAALLGGADWIDFKEPHHGALGPVAVAEALRMVAHLAGRRPLSAALGELLDPHEPTGAPLLAVPGIDVVKLGLAGCGLRNDWAPRWQAALQQAMQHGKHLAAVIYADWSAAAAPAPAAVLDLALASRARFLLVDTWAKAGRTSLEHFSQDRLQQLMDRARQAGLQTVLAGGLTLADFPAAVATRPDLIAVRGAACGEGPRTGSIDPLAVQKLHAALQEAPLQHTAIERIPHAPESPQTTGFCRSNQENA